MPIEFVALDSEHSMRLPNERNFYASHLRAFRVMLSGDGLCQFGHFVG
jgi:hypothetical protein